MSIHVYRSSITRVSIWQSGIDIPEIITSAYEAVKLKHANKYLVFALERVADVAGKPTYG